MKMLCLTTGCLFIILSPKAFSDAPTVMAMSPLPHTLTSTRTTQITVDFSQAMDVSTFNTSTVSVFGHWSGVCTGAIALENGATRMRFTPSEPLFTGELVTVSLSRRIKSQTGDSLTHGHAWTYWIRTGPGTMDLSQKIVLPIRRTGEGHIQTYGAHGGDIDNDGWSDIFAVNEITHDVRVFMNDGTGNYNTFTVYPIPTGNTPSPNESADFNGDGRMDFAVGNAGNDSLSVFIGTGTGSFQPVRNYRAANHVRGVAILDMDGDGDMDVATANRSGNNLSLLRNNGDGTFAPRVSIEANGVQETAIAAADANGDGILDLFVGTYNSNEMIIMLGDGNGGFTFSNKVSAGGKPWMIAVGDMNGDGKVDVVSAKSFNNTASVILGNGLGGLAPAVTYPTGSFALAIDVGDIDGDGDLDLVTSNYGGGTWTVYENNGSGVLGNMRTLQASSAGSCATLHDRDNDGDLDMTGIDELDDLLFVYDNDPPTSVPEQTLPTQTALLNAYPNPFNPVTTLKFAIATASHATLTVFDALGREVRMVVDQHLGPGTYQMPFDARNLTSGIYFYRLTAGRFSEARKLVLLR
jgi:hypothetical protein